LYNTCTDVWTVEKEAEGDVDPETYLLPYDDLSTQLINLQVCIYISPPAWIPTPYPFTSIPSLIIPTLTPLIPTLTPLITTLTPSLRRNRQLLKTLYTVWINSYDLMILILMYRYRDGDVHTCVCTYIMYLNMYVYADVYLYTVWINRYN
jgi:hypothetical protein